jgi:hypothetical protein
MATDARLAFPFALLAVLAMAPAQDLRRALVAADAVVVARAVARAPHGDELALHKLQVLLDVRGAGGAKAVTVLDWPKLALHQRPTLRQSRLYCLQDASRTAERLGLPAADGPYYKMLGFAGSNPLVGAEIAADANVRFAQVFAASVAGAPPADTASALFTTALQGDAAVRTEAAKYLTERPDLRSKLVALQWSQLVTRAAGEVEDVPYKIAMAELCAEQRLDGVFDALVVGLAQVHDPEYARTVGRIGKMLHGEAAATKITERLRQAGQKPARDTLLLTLGATNTDAALDALLRMDRSDAAVEAALREHRSPRAQEAAGKRDKK